MKSVADPPHVTDSPNLLRDTQVKVTLVTMLQLTPGVQKLCRCEHGVFTSRMCVHFEHYFASKSFPAVHEAFSNVYPDKEVPNKIGKH
jgi:hypothetical protein